MKRWKHPHIMRYDYASGEPRGFIREVPESDYRKIMAVYKAAVKVSDTVFIFVEMAESSKLAIEALDKAVEKAEK